MDKRKRRLDSQLCEAVNEGDPRSVELLLSQGARPDLVGRDGAAAIHLAAGKEAEKNTRCLKMLLQHGADPNIRSPDGLTPLHIAALWGCYQNLKLLLTNGGDPNCKDNEGNTPRQLAEQQENRKCAQLLKEYQSSSADTEEDEFPQFQYSVYSDQTNTSSYPESEYSFSSYSSMISDLGEAPLSSTRLSSFSDFNGRPSGRGISNKILSDMDAKRQHWNDSFFNWPSEGASILSSTRMSAVEPAPAMPILKKDDLCTYDGVFATKAKGQAAATAGTVSPSRRDTLPSFPLGRPSRKSVSFRDVDEYFPVFTPETPKMQPAIESSDCTGNVSFDLSEYSEFLDSQRMATVLHTQGLDVTSPDHVYVFSRESSESTEEDMEKTVLIHLPLEGSDDDQEGEPVKETQVDAPVTGLPSSSSGSGSSSGKYSSCDSDHYTSALDTSLHPTHVLLQREKETHAEAESDRTTQISSDCDSEFAQRDGNIPSLSQKPETTESSLDALEELAPSEAKHADSDEFQACRKDAVDQLVDDDDRRFTPSPFVTGRTRSRLSRCSQRMSRTPESLLGTTSLFETTLPTPVRTPRLTPRPQSSGDFYSSPRGPFYTPCFSGSSTEEDHLAADCQDTQSGTLREESSVSNSQADTLILPKNESDSVAESQTLDDTLPPEPQRQNSTVDTYEKNLAEIIRAMQAQAFATDGDFLTDDRTSTDEAITKKSASDACSEDKTDTLKSGDPWISDDCITQPDSGSSSSSSSSYFHPSRSSEELPSTPGTGCTPRYSMSRLSGRSRPQHLARLSYTPGGRPFIQDADEPVEYLYTDTEEGHKLIETHVPPTANTSISSSMSTSSSEETILYDWRSMQADLLKCRGKENQTPQREKHAQHKEENDKDGLLLETSGLTDKELRQRLLEMGQSPGPISSRTRPTYIRRLRQLLLESKGQSPRSRKQSDEQQAEGGYSPELRRALRTFELPDCHADEQALSEQFDRPDENRKWREGIIKSSFNYLLLDPRVTNNLPFRSHTMTLQECFQTFVRAIFYVGKGKRSRPYSHLYEALEYYKGDKYAKKLCPKVQQILQVWNAGQGVISLHCFQNVIPVEAYTREACMVEAVGLNMLTNQKRGDFYGVVSNWQLKKKRELGVHLLYRAMQIFLAEGERQLRPADIRQ